MKFLTICLYAICVCVSLLSCEKVVDVALNEAAPRYVIEATINNNGICRVLLSATAPVAGADSFAVIRNAAVTINDNNSAAFILSEKQPGVYQSSELKGRPGHTYNLRVVIHNKEFTATSVMPVVAVKPDSVYFTTGAVSGSEHLIANVWYKDPVGAGNNYRFIQYVNERKESTVFVNNDKLNDGKSVAFPLFYLNSDNNEKRNINKGDTVRIELQCIDAGMYRYWYSLSTVSGAQLLSAVTPANPVTNISGGALGYFSAYTNRSIRVILRP